MTGGLEGVYPILAAKKRSFSMDICFNNSNALDTFRLRQ
jgi:hypothetical protein